MRRALLVALLVAAAAGAPVEDVWREASALPVHTPKHTQLPAVGEEWEQIGEQSAQYIAGVFDGWCSNWKQLEGKSFFVGLSTGQCFNKCRADPRCWQAVAEVANSDGRTQCFLGETRMTERPGGWSRSGAKNQCLAVDKATVTCKQFDETNGATWQNYAWSGGCYMPLGEMILPLTLEHQLATLVRLTDGATTVPIARSYDGNRWELLHSDYALLRPHHDPFGNSGKSRVIVSDDGHVYQLRGKELKAGTEHPVPAADVSAARFLIQATFGPTRADLRSFTTPAQWIKAQMALPASYTRARWRKRVNPRTVTDGGLRAGGEYGPCDVGSYWNKYAFNRRDLYKAVVATARTNDVVALSVDKVVRTEVSAAWLGQITPGQTVHVCEVQERLGGTVTVDLGTACSDDRTNRVTFSNPMITLSSIDSTRTLSLSSASASLTMVANDADSVVLARMNANCGVSTKGGDNFLVFNDNGAVSTYRLDARTRLQENTIEAPATVKPSAAGSTCPAVRETSTNRQSCKRCAACSAATFTSASLTLDEATIHKWYTRSNRFVYYTDGLKLESPFQESPCKKGVTSRWVAVTGGCTETSLDTDTKATLVEALRVSKDPNPNIRDVNVQETSNGATCNEGTTLGAVVRLGGTCWRHVHPNLYDVFDYTVYAEENDQRPRFAPNPVTQVAAEGGSALKWDDMSRFSGDILHRVRYNMGVVRLGRLGDRVDFQNLPAMAQSKEMAELVGATGSSKDEFYEACGSPGEAGNEPALGHHYRVIVTSRNSAEPELRNHHLAWNGKRMAWTMNSLHARDQLRQRMAWALSQIFVLADVDTDNKLLSEYWLYYHDIFVRHAFGNFADVMRDVAYNPAMSEYLTYKDNKANAEYANSNTFPDENFSREITQLFSIGLYKLHKNGTKVVGENGEYVSTFNTDNIMSMARAWTGFHNIYGGDFRSNLESFKGYWSGNFLDPLRIAPDVRDIFPKHDLNGNYIGDGYALCKDLPEAAFLGKGARFRFTGLEAGNDDPYMTLSSSSALYGKLCSARSGKCSFPREVVLDTTLQCHEKECRVDEVSMVKLTDGSTSAFYTWKRPPCVSFSFYEGGRRAETSQKSAICADPESVAGGSACCTTHSWGVSMVCATQYPKEIVKWQTNVDRCNKTINSDLDQRFEWHQCDAVLGGVPNYGQCRYSGGDSTFLWAKGRCSVKVLVNPRGMVNIVHDTCEDVEPPSHWANPTCQAQLTNTDKCAKRQAGTLNDGYCHKTCGVCSSASTTASHFQPTNEVKFHVPWQGESYPTRVDQNTCGGSCIAYGADSCLCEAMVSERAVFSAASMPGSEAEVLEQLKVGSPPLEMFSGAERYSVCQTGVCKGILGVTVYTRASGAIDANAVFHVKVHGVSHYRRNVVSTVAVGAHSFRNPVQFMPTHRPVRLPSFLQDAEYETQALLDHLFYHDNTAPFISHQLIQRFVTSNPSPRYVETVAAAFQTGTFSGTTYSGRYGDLGATVAAILVDQEARSAVLDLDPAWGKMHEPILKVVHLLRSMEVDTQGKEMELFNMDQLIGQMPFSSPSVFNFYLPDYAPVGAVSAAGLYAPEAQLGTAPFVVGFLNGVASLINNGLTNCRNGFGSPWLADGSVKYTGDYSCKGYPLVGKTHAFLKYLPEATEAADVVAELAKLLTGRHLSSHTAKLLTQIYKDSAKKIPDIDPKNGVVAPGCYYKTPSGCAQKEIIYAPTFFLPDTFSSNMTFRQDEHSCLVDRKRELIALCKRDNIETQFLPDDGFRKVLRLLMASPEFHISNYHSPTLDARAAAPSVTGRSRKMKAVVVLWMNGGADSFNLLVPHSECKNGKDLYAEYAQRRGSIAQRQGDLLQINSRAGSQPCNKFGLHPTMTHFKQLYEAGDLAFIANAGSLVEPVTKADYDAAKRTKQFPPSLFAHNIMQRAAETVDATNPSSDGILGRIGEVLETGQQAYKTGIYSTSGNKKLVMGGPAAPKASMLDRRYGVVRYDEYNEWNSTIEELLGGTQSSSIFAESHVETLSNALKNTESLGAVLDDVTVSTTFPSTIIGEQFEQVAKVLAGGQQTKEERAAFVVELGGWDHHSDAVKNMNAQMAEVNAAVQAFSTELKAQGIWDDVAVLTYSEFARTLTSNGAGTDHAWGGNYMLMGGAVKGGQILGQYPESLAEDSEADTGRGRFLPTTSWEAIWNGLAEWLGVDSADMDKLLPNKKNFASSQLFNKNDFFN